jgi:ribosomal protein S16
MAKITVNKMVYWKESGRELSGKVKQVLSDHVVITSSAGDLTIVRKAQLYLKK